MKKTILLPLLAGFFLAASAQTIIPKAGLTVATNSISTDNFGSQGAIKSQTGYTFGIAVVVPITANIAVQPELNYIRKGFKYDYSGGDGFFYYEESNKLSYNYLEIPVLLRYSLGPDAFKIHVNLGPSVGYGLGGKHNYRYYYDPGDGQPPVSGEIEGSVKFDEEPEGYEGEDIYLDKRIDIGLQGGAGITLFNKIFVDIRYGLGLTNIREKDIQGDTKNRVIQFTVGVPLSLF